MSKMNGGKDTKFTVEPSRRTLLKSALALAVGTAVAPMAATSAAASDAPVASTGTGLPPETEPKPGLDPHKNPSWEGWDNPRLGRTNGWGTSETEAWTTILNPQNLPIYHDRFYRIPESNRKHHWVMVMDTRKCVGCQACVVSCKSENNIPLGVYRTWVDVYQTGDTVPDPQGDITLDDGQRYRMDAKVVNMPKICNHCAHPPCVEVCPVKATFKRQDGIVMVDPRLCIGCGTCVNACPYDARYINPISKVADKCTFCVERTDAGLLPACVTSCVGRARVFGDILDPNSEVSRLLAHYPHSVRHPEFGTDPQVFYIGESGDISTDPDPNVQHMVFTYTSNANSNVPDTVDVI